MRFKADVQNINTFYKLVSALTSIGSICWVRLSLDDIRFTIIPEQGSQVWAVLSINTVFDQYTIVSQADNVINLEIPIGQLTAALKSALNAVAAELRLTKVGNQPILCLKITSLSGSSGTFGSSFNDQFDGDGQTVDLQTTGNTDRTHEINQQIPIRVLSPETVANIHEPRCPDPDVHIQLPNLKALKSISDQFTQIAIRDTVSRSGRQNRPIINFEANMHGCLRLSVVTDPQNISCLWTELSNPELDPTQVEGGEEGIANHPSTIMKQKGSADGKSLEGWASVRIDGKDLSKVLSIGKLSGRVIACVCDKHAIVLYVYLQSEEEEEDSSVLTYYIAHTAG
ncbi:Hus1-like protein [Patellaria atrata CBS 101060]|uniref:Checkpoint protein n=1 Tax=Patellaria atrata CBS 101060 TaxID=1346257 RepID=A0A9P4VQV7_9PEZI|nr:Hus1-like protein [Patellaria atrata CBS 101060]